MFCRQVHSSDSQIHHRTSFIAIVPRWSASAAKASDEVSLSACAGVYKLRGTGLLTAQATGYLADMKTFHCNSCNQQVFFENVLCERCGHMLGYVEDIEDISAFDPDNNGFWLSLDPNSQASSYKQCQNYATEHVCNRMIPVDDPETLCKSCRLTLTIPSLTSDANREYWYKLERAKRRLLYTLTQLNLPIESRQDDPET